MSGNDRQMNREEAVRVFRQFLDRLEIFQSQIDCFCWFCDDFEKYMPEFLDEIEAHINQISFIAPQKSVIAYFYLLDAMCKRCNQAYLMAIGEKLPTWVSNALRRSQDEKDIKLTESLGKLIDHWSTEKLLSDGILDRLKDAFKQVTVPEPEAIGTENVNVVIEQSEPVVFNDTIQFVGTEEEERTEERRLARAWMRGQMEWETPNEPSLLVVDVDSDNKQPIQSGSMSYIVITPENERATCASCSGAFERGIGPNGKLVFKGATYVKGTGYMHQECYRLDLRDQAPIMQLFGQGK